MEIRRIAITSVAFAVACLAHGGPIQIYPLDERIVYTIRVSSEKPTTCLFPGALTALEGGNVSPQAVDGPPVLLSYQAGAAFFSVRALRDDANAAINMVFRGRVYVLDFRASDTADRAISFVEEPIGNTDRQAKPVAPESIQSLIERAKNYESFAAQYPALTQTIQRAMPNIVTLYPGFTVTLTDVFRFDPEDTLVLCVRLENQSDAAIRFDPSGLAVRVGSLVYPVALADGPSEISPRGQATIWFAVTRSPNGSRANLSVHNAFSVLVPRVL